MQKEPDYVPDGARLVQICGLCAEDGHEISFAPDGIAALMKGHEESADGSTFMQAMYERMLFGNKAFKELFRALEAGETPSCSTARPARTAPAWRPCSFCWHWALRMRRSVRTMSARTSAARLRSTQCWRSTLKRSRQTRPAGCAITARRAWTRQPHPLCCAPSAQKYGSAENYLEAEYGLTPARLMRLRRMYLE